MLYNKYNNKLLYNALLQYLFYLPAWFKTEVKFAIMRNGVMCDLIVN